MSEVTAKAKSAINSLNKALSAVEKTELALMQAKVALPKGDLDSRNEVEKCIKQFKIFKQTVESTINVITEMNPSQAEGD